MVRRKYHWRQLAHRIGYLLLLVGAGHTQGMEFSLPQQVDVIGQTQSINLNEEDTFAAIGERYELGYTELIIANADVDPWLPGEGAQITLPTRFILPNVERRGIVVNLAEYRLYYFPENEERVYTYPVGIGTEEFPSPLFTTHVRTRIENPAWYPPPSIRKRYERELGITLPFMVPPGPDNPLGPFALVLEDGYLIHGTNKAFGIGARISHGCIRMYNAHIEDLIYRTPNQTPVRFIDRAIKFGFQGDDLLMEVHATGKPVDVALRQELATKAVNRLTEFEQQHGSVQLDPLAFRKAIAQATGTPAKVGRRAPK